MKKVIAVIMLMLATGFAAQEAFGRGGRGGGRSGGVGRGSSGRGNRGKNREKDVKRDRERAVEENRDAFRRDAAEDAA